MSEETVLPQGFLSGIKSKAFMTEFLSSEKNAWGRNDSNESGGKIQMEWVSKVVSRTAKLLQFCT